MNRITANFWDIDVSATANLPNSFNVFNRTYADGTDASSLSANGWKIGSGTTTPTDTYQNYWNMMQVVMGNASTGEGFICGGMDNNTVDNSAVWGAGMTGHSLDMLGPHSAGYPPCNSNIFNGAWGTSTSGTRPIAETGSTDNRLYLQLDSGQIGPTVSGTATLTYTTSAGDIWTNGTGSIAYAGPISTTATGNSAISTGGALNFTTGTGAAVSINFSGSGGNSLVVGPVADWRWLNHAGSGNNFEFFDNGTFEVYATTASTSPTTGAIIDGGGLGVAGAGYIGGSLFNPGIASGAQADVVCTTSTGKFSYQVSATGCAASAKRLKNPLGSIIPQDALDRLMGLPSGVQVWTYKDTAGYGPQPYEGLYADDVCAMDPKLCARDKDGRVANYDKNGVLAYAVAAIQAEQREILMLQWLVAGLAGLLLVVAWRGRGRKG